MNATSAQPIVDAEATHVTATSKRALPSPGFRRRVSTRFLSSHLFPQKRKETVCFPDIVNVWWLCVSVGSLGVSWSIRRCSVDWREETPSNTKNSCGAAVWFKTLQKNSKHFWVSLQALAVKTEINWSDPLVKLFQQSTKAVVFHGSCSKDRKRRKTERRLLASWSLLETWWHLNIETKIFGHRERVCFHKLISMWVSFSKTCRSTTLRSCNTYPTTYPTDRYIVHACSSKPKPANKRRRPHLASEITSTIVHACMSWMYFILHRSSPFF